MVESLEATNGSTGTRSTGAKESRKAPGAGTSADATLDAFARPVDARRLAGQINTVATGVLNGYYGAAQLELIRVYAGMVRSIAQLMTAETSRARQAKEAPDLSLPDIDDDE